MKTTISSSIDTDAAPVKDTPPLDHAGAAKTNCDVSISAASPPGSVLSETAPPKDFTDRANRYPLDMEVFLHVYGADPEDHVHAHEFNLRAIELQVVFEPLLHRRDMSLCKFFRPAIDALSIALGISSKATTEDRSVPIASPPTARMPEEIEVPADWLSRYPTEYARILTEHGVATVPGSRVDRYNRRLVELLPHDCVDEAAIEEAKSSAVIAAFGGTDG